MSAVRPSSLNELRGFSKWPSGQCWVLLLPSAADWLKPIHQSYNPLIFMEMDEMVFVCHTKALMQSFHGQFTIVFMGFLKLTTIYHREGQGCRKSVKIFFCHINKWRWFTVIPCIPSSWHLCLAVEQKVKHCLPSYQARVRRAWFCIVF